MRIVCILTGFGTAHRRLQWGVLTTVGKLFSELGRLRVLGVLSDVLSDRTPEDKLVVWSQNHQL